MMKSSIKWLLISLFILLSGCSSEPMIKLSEENQAKLEEKRQQSQVRVDEPHTEASPSQSQQEETVADVNQSMASTIDPSSWTRLPDETVLDLSNFLPFYPYQLKQFNNVTGMYTTYVDYFDEANRVMQVREIVGADTFVSAYRWDETQIQMTLRQENIALFENMLETGQQTADNVMTLLSAPLTVGTTWSYDGTHQSEILGLYEEVTLGELTFTQVIETSTQFEDYDLRQYYAAEDGLIGTRYVTSTEATEAEDFWQITSKAHQVMMIVNQSIAQPQTDENSLLALEKVSFAFQTNDTMARAFQRLFTEQGWITDDIVINSISVDETGIATIDFSSGVVSAFNQHHSKEAGVIPAIVTTIGQFLDVTQVRLTVNNNGLLPDTLPYPPKGVYEVDASWLAN
ncbi:GerMN domain-containing protein [Fundicoccus sp. Sow4_D5]|uniref:GerMN domain-containing protein n=1 Tax=Fundicoccus sp. Sow4_D5 TaxID=3438782 RepID=UPI003F90D509